jgi:hypothetical protein
VIGELIRFLGPHRKRRRAGALVSACNATVSFRAGLASVLTIAAAITLPGLRIERTLVRIARAL